MFTKHSLEQIINVSKDVYRISSLNQALIDLSSDGEKLVINTQWSQTDFEKNERTKFQKNFILATGDAAKSKAAATVVHVTKPQAIRNE
jgi:hypothetical protein